MLTQCLDLIQSANATSFWTFVLNPSLKFTTCKHSGSPPPSDLPFCTGETPGPRRQKTSSEVYQCACGSEEGNTRNTRAILQIKGYCSNFHKNILLLYEPTWMSCQLHLSISTSKNELLGNGLPPWPGMQPWFPQLSSEKLPPEAKGSNQNHSQIIFRVKHLRTSPHSPNPSSLGSRNLWKKKWEEVKSQGGGGHQEIKTL